MKRSISVFVAALTMSGGAAVTMASPAAAAKPLVFEQGEFDATFVDSGELNPCGFDVMVHQVGSFKTTVFFDKNGETRLAKSHANGTTSYSLPGGDIVATDRWVNNTFFELAPGSGPETPPLSVTTVGNIWNLHSSSGGMLINDSGRIVFDGDGNVVSINGPHEAFTDGFGPICDALAASDGA